MFVCLIKLCLGIKKNCRGLLLIHYGFWFCVSIGMCVCVCLHLFVFLELPPPHGSYFLFVCFVLFWFVCIILDAHLISNGREKGCGFGWVEGEMIWDGLRE